MLQKYEFYLIFALNFYIKFVKKAECLRKKERRITIIWYSATRICCK